MEAVAPENMPHVYSAADVFCMASVSEGLSLTMLEALAAGLPVISFNHGSDAEIVQEDEGCLLHQSNMRGYAGAMVRFCRYPEMLRDMKKRARQRAGLHNWRRMMLRHEEVFLSRLAEVRG